MHPRIRERHSVYVCPVRMMVNCYKLMFRCHDENMMIKV